MAFIFITTLIWFLFAVFKKIDVWEEIVSKSVMERDLNTRVNYTLLSDIPELLKVLNRPPAWLSEKDIKTIIYRIKEVIEIEIQKWEE